MRSFAFIFLFLWACPVWGTEIFIPPTRAEADGTVVVSVMIDQVDNLAGIELVIRYDPGMLQYRKAAKTRQTKSLIHVVNAKKPGQLKLVMAGAKGIKGADFAVARIEFAATPQATAQTTVVAIEAVQLMNDQLKGIDCQVKNGSVVIAAAPLRP
ncbi:MAG: hypothetical protein JEZ11_17195 [Desulfobacterales bacterium]|nr:hypothetical protein [Desulfobacterales bacterium]